MAYIPLIKETMTPSRRDISTQRKSPIHFKDKIIMFLKLEPERGRFRKREEKSGKKGKYEGKVGKDKKRLRKLFEERW